MKNNFMRKILKSSLGFTMVEGMISIGLLAGLSYIGLKQSDVLNRSMFNVSLERRIDEFHSSLNTLVSTKQACEKNFSSNPIQSTYSELKDGNGNVPYAVDGKYLDNRVQVKSIATRLIDGNAFLEISLEKLTKKAQSKTVTKRVPLLVELDASQNIASCFSLSSGMENTVKSLVARKICEQTYGGIDSHFDSVAMTCRFDGFADGASTACPAGESVTSITYNSSTGNYTPNCTSPLTIPSSCPNNWVKKINVNGVVECANLADYIDTDVTGFAANNSCGLKIDTATNRVKVECGTCTNPTCPLPSTVTCDEQVMDSCGNPCPGLMGTNECAVYTCPSIEYGYRPATTATLPIGNYGQFYSMPSGSYCGSGRGFNCICGGDPSTPLLLLEPGGGSPTATGPITWNCAPKPACTTGGGIDDDDNSGTPGGNPGCFTAGTQISMYDGTKKNIEDVTTEDVLMGTSRERVKVIGLMQFDRHSYKYSFNGSPYFATGGHPFKTVDGWKVFDMVQGKKDNPTLKIKPLKIGDAILTENGFEIVRYFSRVKNWERVYNFEVDGKHEYIADGYYVHNRAIYSGCCDQPLSHDSGGNQVCLGNTSCGIENTNNYNNLKP